MGLVQALEQTLRLVSLLCQNDSYKKNMKLNRQLQREILESLRSIYPNQNAADPWLENFKDREDLWGNVAYLHEHGLIAGWSAPLGLDSPG